MLGSRLSNFLRFFLLFVIDRISGSINRSLTLGEATGPLFFDLLLDPNEANLLDVDPPASNYTDIYAELRVRGEYWSSLVKSAEIPDGTYKKSYWKKAGGVVPWITDDNFTASVIPKKYNVSDAPNIVFVLVDDWVKIILSS